MNKQLDFFRLSHDAGNRRATKAESVKEKKTIDMYRRKVKEKALSNQNITITMQFLKKGGVVINLYSEIYFLVD
jgi:hypothetical protein